MLTVHVWYSCNFESICKIMIRVVIYVPKSTFLACWVVMAPNYFRYSLCCHDQNQCKKSWLSIIKKHTMRVIGCSAGLASCSCIWMTIIRQHIVNTAKKTEIIVCFVCGPMIMQVACDYFVTYYETTMTYLCTIWLIYTRTNLMYIGGVNRLRVRSQLWS